MLTGLLIALLVVIALLAIPLELDFRFAWPDGGHNELVLVWAGGLVRARIPSERSKPASPAADEPSAPRKPGRGGSRNFLAALRQRRFRQRVYRFIGNLWRSISKENMHVRARIGLGDPADTGHLWAVVGPVSGLLADVKEISVAIEPDFVDATFEIDSRGRLKIVPLQVIPISIGLLMSPAIWQGLRSMRAS